MSCNCTLWLSIIGGLIPPLLYLLRWYMQGAQFKKNHIRADGKIVIVTGSNSGIGKEATLELAKRGAKIYMACIGPQKTEAARHEIIEASKNKNVFSIPLDLSSLESVRQFVKEFLKKESRLDILINNAGLSRKGKTKDGFEIHFGVNHLGPFLLTNLLLDTIKKSNHGRIVNVASRAHMKQTINADTMNDGSFQLKSYGRSKLANILFTRELAKRLRGTNVTTNSLHPGIVKTDIIVKNFGIFRSFVSPILSLLLKTPRSGAQTTIAVALDPDFEKISGRYFDECKVAEEWDNAKDDEAAKWLWEISEQLTGLKK